MKAKSLERSIIINQSKKNVWNVITSKEMICNTHPIFSDSPIFYVQVENKKKEYISKNKKNNEELEEKIVQIDNCKSITLKIQQPNDNFNDIFLLLQLSIQGTGGQTILTGSMEFEIKRTLHNCIYKLFLKRRIAKQLESILAGSKRYIETGEIITPETELDLYQVIE